VVLLHSRAAALASLSLALPRRASNCRAQRSADHKQPTLIWELGANYGLRHHTSGTVPTCCSALHPLYILSILDKVDRGWHYGWGYLQRHHSGIVLG
jgi:hypothetical protein